MGPFTFRGVEIDAQDPVRVGAFWAELLGWRQVSSDACVIVAPPGSPAHPLFVMPDGSAKAGQNRIHLDLTSSSAADMETTILRALRLGAVAVDSGQLPEEEHVVLADVEGNEFCVIEPTNRFLADTGVVGAINCDGTRALGLFWSRVLHWPLVWDQAEETAIQAPEGGPKITWSGPPLMPRWGRDRLRLVVSTEQEMDAAVAELRSLGATIDGEPAGAQAMLRDPDGNEFRLIVAGGDGGVSA